MDNAVSTILMQSVSDLVKYLVIGGISFLVTQILSLIKMKKDLDLVMKAVNGVGTKVKELSEDHSKSAKKIAHMEGIFVGMGIKKELRGEDKNG